MEYTTNLNLKKPATTDNVLISDINENMDTLDSNIKSVEDNATSLEKRTEAIEGAVEVKSGTWTPTPNSAAVTFSVSDGEYYKVGNMVFVKGYIDIQSTYTDNKTIVGFSGLPFASATEAALNIYYGTMTAYTSSEKNTYMNGYSAFHINKNTKAAEVRAYFQGRDYGGVNWDCVGTGGMAFSGVYITNE